MKLRVVTFFAALVLFTSPVHAQIFRSAFGFSAVISDSWIVISRETLAQNPGLIEYESNDFAGVDESTVAQVRQMTESGRFEFLYHRHSDGDFQDNVNFFLSDPNPSNLALALQPLCDSLQAQLQQAFNRTEFTTVHFCQQGENPFIDMLVYSFDGAVIGTRSFGYVFNTSSGTVTMTLTCKVSKCEQVRPDAEKLFLELTI